MKTGGLHQLQLLGSEPVTNSIKTLWWTEYIMHTKFPSANEDFFYIFLFYSLNTVTVQYLFLLILDFAKLKLSS